MTDRLTRQSFLGPQSSAVIRRARLGFVGIGGGGSHLVQQAAHIGFRNYVLADPQCAELSNTNRLIGCTLKDIEDEMPKVMIGRRTILSLEPKAKVQPLQRKWQQAVEELRDCDLIFGAVDGLGVRDELERFCRTHLIAYIDIGMAVTEVAELGYLLSGQIIQSMPGQPCMHCSQFITPEKLAIETERYGDAGENPQVVWPNGVLASTAIGLGVRLLTPWASGDEFVYLSYDGNSGSITASRIAELVRGQRCPHHPLTEVGDPFFKPSKG